MSSSDNLGGIDAQHHQLSEKGKGLCRLLRNKCTFEELSRALPKFLELMRVHFSEEEKLMRCYAYTGLESHKRTHDFLLAKLTEITEETLEAFTPWTEERLLKLLENDIHYHIIEDQNAWESGKIGKEHAYQRLHDQVASQEAL